VPELPEVETVVRDLRPALVGRIVRSAAAGPLALRVPWRGEWAALVAGATITAIRRRGKWILIDLQGGGALLGHLGMTGQLRVLRADEPAESHTHLSFTLDDGHELRFRDIRRFGSFQYLAAASDLDTFIGERLGPEPWDLQPASWYRDLRSSRRPLKALLLDQAVVAGVGNIYADESLFAARLPPRQRGALTTRVQAERLRLAILATLDQAIAARGSTIRNYVGGSGLEGGFQHEHRVYARAGKACLVCGELIHMMRLAGRSTHWCPGCQRSSRVRS